MSGQVKNNSEENIDAVHQYYMEVINSMPNIVYWIDKNCNLQGCNKNFIKLLNVQTLDDHESTPYDHMEEHAHWSKNRVNALRLDDMRVLFSEKPLYNVDEKPIHSDDGKVFHFQATRVPMYNHKKEVIGLVVALTEIDHTNKYISSFVENKEETLPTFKDGYLPKVLMVEDNVIAQNVEKALLTALHCQVDIADTAERAVELFYPGKYDLVLMDIGLDDSSGYIVAKRLREKEENTEQHVPIIALTGYEADIVKYDCQHYCMEGAITKPLTCEQAEQIIKHYIYHMDVPVRGLKI